MDWGFSYVGLIYLLMLTIPNLVWAKNLPKDYSTQSAQNENKVLAFCERIGQALVTITILIFRDFNLRPFSWWSLWLIASFLVMLLYECWWIGYFRSNQTIKDFYRNFFGIPLAGATLPTLAFILLSIYGKNLILFLASLLFGIGHIGIHFKHRKGLTT